MKVLVALDGSDCSLAALDSVIERQWLSNAEFRLLSVVEPPPAEGAEEIPQYAQYLDEAQQLLFRQARQLVNERVEYVKRELPHSRIIGKVIEGNVVDSIVREASRWGADVIIMGSHGRSGVQKALLGSVAEAVVGRASCPVEIVRKNHSPGKRKNSVQATAS